MAMMEISIIPVGTKSTSLSLSVAQCLKSVAHAKGVKIQLTAMGTIIEAGSTQTLLRLAEVMHKRAFSAGSKRVITTIKIDERRDKKTSMEGKVRAVLRRISA